ncbi:MAG: glycoside hydrolase family 97 protein [Chitinophagaceae bacterium]|nr:glycoside hydrolase family 97 protein [Chitinophagaceae bacterium]
MLFRVFYFIGFNFLIVFSGWAQVHISSPDQNILVVVSLNGNGQIFYKVSYKNVTVLQPSKLGMHMGAENYETGMRMTDSGRVSVMNDSYTLMHGKKKHIHINANVRILRFMNTNGQPLFIEFSVANDGVAFRYHFPGDAKAHQQITKEGTSFNFPSDARAWLQPMQVSKTGWEQTNPAYEEHYQMDIPVGTVSTMGAGWVYPALFRTGDIWMLITETGVEGHHCATRLSHFSPDGEYSVAFPDPREVITGKGLLPRVVSNYNSPWRILAIGSLATIVENTLGTDFALPKVAGDFSFVQPGKASWSWINSKDDYIIYDEQKRYIEFAADMKWQYCLIDAGWDRKIGYEKVKELADFAKTKKVKLLLWYNSAGDWNTVKLTPKSQLLTQELREKEFDRLKQMGIAGVKIDFFAGDGQSVMEYYQDILKDAAKAGLMVNFHGATLPRGWSRTYPNLLTTEAVKGFEMVTFNQNDADKQAAHCTMLPFTRNVYDPMDFTPMNLYKIQTNVQRKTSAVFELATSVLFTSGIQHFAESPEGMSKVPERIKDFLRGLPDTWDDVRLIDGYPGRYVVIARKAGNKWYVAGINGSETDVSIKIDPTLFGARYAWMVNDGEGQFSFSESQPATVQPVQISMKPSGGFVLMLE